MTPTFTIEAAADGSTLIFTSAAGEKSVVIFPSREKAEAFIGASNTANLKVVELTPSTAPEWLAKMKCYGVHDAILDPSAQSEIQNGGHAKLDAVLTALGGEAGK